MSKSATGKVKRELELNLIETTRTISDELKEALERTIIPNVADKSKDYRFSAIWTAVLKAENRMATDLWMYAEPNGYEEVEIGYGTYHAFQNKG